MTITTTIEFDIAHWMKDSYTSVLCPSLHTWLAVIRSISVVTVVSLVTSSFIRCRARNFANILSRCASRCSTNAVWRPYTSLSNCSRICRRSDSDLSLRAACKASAWARRASSCRNIAHSIQHYCRSKQNQLWIYDDSKQISVWIC